MYKEMEEYMDYVNLGIRIKLKRTELNLTQEKLAEKAKISTAYMGQIERGEKRLSLDNFVNIANALNCSTDELLRGSTEKNSNARFNEIFSILKNSTNKDLEQAIDILKILSRK